MSCVWDTSQQNGGSPLLECEATFQDIIGMAQDAIGSHDLMVGTELTLTLFHFEVFTP